MLSLVLRLVCGKRKGIIKYLLGAQKKRRSNFNLFCFLKRLKNILRFVCCFKVKRYIKN